MSYLKTFLKFILTLVAVGYLSSIGYLYVMQDRLIFPAPDHQARTTDGTVFSEISIKTPDNEVLLGFHHPPEPGEATIILFHGNGGTASGYFNKATTWTEAGFGALLMEYRGYPGSTGSPSEAALFQDAILAYDHVQNQSDAPIVLYGHSLGTGVATYLTSQRDAAALVLEAPFDALVNIAADRYPWVPVYPLTKHKFQSHKYIKDISAPTLIMHGTADKTVPISYGRKLHQAAKASTEFITFEGAGHSNLNAFGANEIAIDFMQNALGLKD